MKTERPALRGAVNAVSPGAPSQAGFASAVAAAVGSRARLKVPAWFLKLMAGKAAGLLLEGQAAVPRRALAAGYRFRLQSLDEAVAELAAGTRSFAEPAAAVATA